MSDNQCVACGQFSGKGHKCPPHLVPTSANMPPAPSRTASSPLTSEVANRVASAQAAIATLSRDPVEGEWNDNAGHGPEFEVVLARGEINSEASGQFGDDAVGTAYETVVRRKRPDGNYESITVADYVEAVETTNQPEVRDAFIVSERTEILVHSDPDDPGGSEITSDYQYSEGSVLFYDTQEEAEAEALRVNRTISADLFN